MFFLLIDLSKALVIHGFQLYELYFPFLKESTGYEVKIVIFNFLTGQKQEMAGLKFVWPVKMTGNVPDLSPDRAIERTLRTCCTTHDNQSTLFSCIDFNPLVPKGSPFDE